MTQERKLAENLKRVNPVLAWITQGIVKATDGVICTVTIGDADIEGIRLRASLTERERQMLVVPKVGSAVTLGSLTGDLTELIVLQVDEVESVTFNGGKLGGLINIQELTDKINELVEKFNDHTHMIAAGAISTVGSATAQKTVTPVKIPAVNEKAGKLKREDYEDTYITH